MISRRLAVAESLRAYYVTHAITGEEDSTCQLLLSVSSNIARNHGQAHREAKSLEVAKPEGDQSAPFIRIREPNKESRSNDAYGVGCHHCYASHVRELGADISTSD